MAGGALLVDGFERLRDAMYPAVNGLSLEELAFRPDGESNSVAWLAWHVARVQDDVVSRLAGSEPVWTAMGWSDRFALPLDPADTGRGHGPEQVALVTADARSLLDYFEDVHGRTVRWLHTLSDEELERARGDRQPPVTIASSLMLALVDDLQHVGQAAFLRGLVQRRATPPPVS
jgi:uncharacterized damage-inducible protein DinB